LTEIGAAFGIANYSTVSSAVERIKKRKQEDQKLKLDIKTIETLLSKKGTDLFSPEGFSSKENKSVPFFCLTPSVGLVSPVFVRKFSAKPVK